MSKPAEVTAQGFGIYGRIPSHGGGSVQVQESNLAGCGAHVWLFLDGKNCCETQLNVASAKLLIEALSAFIASAESDEFVSHDLDNREPPLCECGAPVCRDSKCARCLDREGKR